jgi:hypothetical protein
LAFSFQPARLARLRLVVGEGVPDEPRRQDLRPIVHAAFNEFFLLLITEDEGAVNLS